MNRRRFLKHAGTFLGVAAIVPTIVLEVSEPTRSFSNANDAVEPPELSWRNLVPEDITEPAILAELLVHWKVRFGTDCTGADLEFLRLIVAVFAKHMSLGLDEHVACW